ncbi:MAG: alkylation repair protein [Paenibacillus sp.]|nr:alkylation repair protein [Paenibacillus sp.]
MESSIRQQLLERAEPEYQAFAASLIPGVRHLVGVRLPELRKMAQNISKGDWRSYLADAQNEWFEEVMLQGMVIGCAKAELGEILQHTAAFVPKIDNWSVCDSFCTGLKIVQSDRAAVWTFLQPYLDSDREYDIRFGAVTLLNYYVDEAYIDAVLDKLDRIRHPAYYVKMAVAWAISICFIKLPERTMSYLQHNSLDTETFNRALQKIVESYRVDAEMKKRIRAMKRKS